MLELLEGRALEGSLFVHFEAFPMGADDLRCRVGCVFDAAPQHLREQVAGSQMDGTYLRQVLVIVCSQTVFAEAVVQFLFHAAFIFHTAEGVVKEIFIENDACMFVPPGRVKHDVDGQFMRAQLFHSQFV